MSELNVFYIPTPMHYEDSSIWQVSALTSIVVNNSVEPELFLRKNLKWNKINLQDESSPFFNYFYNDDIDNFKLIKRSVNPKNYDYLIFLWDFWNERIKLFSTDVERLCNNFEVEDFRDWHPHFSRDFANADTDNNKIKYEIAKKAVKIDSVLCGHYFGLSKSSPENIVYELVGTTQENDTTYTWVRRQGRWVNAGGYLEYPTGQGWNEEPDFQFIDELKANDALKTWDEYDRSGLLVPVRDFDKYLIN